MPPENIHMTLSFLGNVSLTDIPKLNNTLEYALDLNYFRVSIEKTGILPSFRYPKILWLDVGSGRQEMLELQTLVEKVAAPFKTYIKKEKYIPHITIGRVV